MTHRRQGRPAPSQVPHRRAMPTRPPGAHGWASADPSFVAVTSASAPSFRRRRPTSTRNRARCDSSATLPPNAQTTSVSLDTSPGHASPSAREGKQDWTPCERDHRACVTHDMTARVHDEGLRCQQLFDVREQEESLPAVRNQACRRRVEDDGCPFDVRHQRRNTCVPREPLGPSERSSRCFRSESPHRDSRHHQLMRGPRRGRQRGGVELRERTLGLVEVPDQEQAPDLEIPRMRGVCAIAVLFQRRARRVSALDRPR